MLLRKIGLTTLVTLLAGISTPVSLTAKAYALSSQTNPERLEIAQSQSDELNQWLKQGDSLLDKNNYAQALKAYEQAIGINSNSPGAWGGRGEALYGLKQYKEAIASFQRAIDLNPKLRSEERRVGKECR